MTPERWQEVKGVLSAVLETNPSNRSAYLDAACHGDARLRAEIEDLLAAEQASSSSLLAECTTFPVLKNDASSGSRIGRRIGPYQIIEEIGVGGMGEVYRAYRADDQYRKEVAIKLVRAGQDTRFVVTRFLTERQVLAILDHPNIARLLDGGTTEDGLPYFVMELIEGQPILEYCVKNRLPVEGRLRLFLEVCSAVQYAHQRLIVHRDLKPGNILVTQDGIPKLLDFGIAKLLDPGGVIETSDPTISIFRLLTPSYASPEQLKGEAITTASDVYSLGVLLYELLTGHRPYRTDGRAPHEVARIVCELEPEKPSKTVKNSELDGPERTNSLGSSEVVHDGYRDRLSKHLRGDLDNIILVALRKEPQQRYPSVEQLSSDIQRHLSSLPVSASRGTLTYRASKFIRRNKAGFITVSAVVLALIVGLGTTLFEAHRARVQQLRAEQRFNDLRELANSLMFDVHDSIQDLPGSTSARKLIVQHALHYLDSLSRDSASDVSLQRELATAYEKVGTVQGNPFGANLGDLQGAVDSYRKALSIRETFSQANGRNVADLVALARNRRLLAATLANETEGWDEHKNMENESEALATAERAYGLAPSDPQVLQELGADYALLVTFRNAVGDYQAASDYLNKQQGVLQALSRSNPNERTVRVALAQNKVRSGQELTRLGFQKEALESIRQGILVFTSLSSDGTDAKSTRYLGLSRDCLADALLMSGQASEAVISYREEVRGLEALQRRDPNDAVVQYDLATATAKLGNALAIGGDVHSGLSMLEKAAAMLQSQIDRDPSYNEPPWSLGLTRLWMGEVLARNRQLVAALENYRKAVDIWKDDNHPVAQVIAADIHLKVAIVLGRSGKLDEAFEAAKSAINGAEHVLSEHPYLVDARYVLADSYAAIGDFSKAKAMKSVRSTDKARYWAESQTYYRQSLDMWQSIHDPGVRAPAGFACGNPTQVANDLVRSDVAIGNVKGK